MMEIIRKRNALNTFFPIRFYLGPALLLLSLSCLAPHAHAAFGFNLDGTLDRGAISHAYFEGDFSRIRPPLEAFRLSLSHKTQDDSVFAFKYLSVIYAADPLTRPKAESYMVQLVRMKPTIELVDLYLSDSIEALFIRVKEKYLKQQQYTRSHDLTGNPKPADTTAIPTPVVRSSSRIWWAVGGMGVAAAVAVGYYALQKDPVPQHQPEGTRP